MAKKTLKFIQTKSIFPFTAQNKKKVKKTQFETKDSDFRFILNGLADFSLEQTTNNL